MWRLIFSFWEVSFSDTFLANSYIVAVGKIVTSSINGRVISRGFCYIFWLVVTEPVFLGSF